MDAEGAGVKCKQSVPRAGTTSAAQSWVREDARAKLHVGFNDANPARPHPLHRHQ